MVLLSRLCGDFFADKKCGSKENVKKRVTNFGGRMKQSKYADLLTHCRVFKPMYSTCNWNTWEKAFKGERPEGKEN